MLAINSKIKLDLAAAPQAKTAGLFNECLVAYSAVRSVQVAASSAFGFDETAPESATIDDLIALYAINNNAKVVMRAFSAIIAGRFLECFKSDGQYYVRHTRNNGSNVSLGSLGVSLENKAAGEYVEVYISPSIIPGFTGLVPGKPYRFFDDGQFTDTALNVRTCGVAITDRHMRIISFGLYDYA